MKCWNCENALESALLCNRCGMPQPVDVLGAFEALGIPPRLRWPEEEIERTYERMALQCHPDLFRAHRDERVINAARVAMRTLNDAYRTLKDRTKRLRYVLAASGRATETTRTVPEGLHESAQIISRILSAVEDARQKGDREAWESHQDHVASLQVQAEAAMERARASLQVVEQEWDDAVRRAGDHWPEVPEGWEAQVQRWLGEQEYLDALMERLRAGRFWEKTSNVAGG
jgi:curved DNA-binding protein CbpA